MNVSPMTPIVHLSDIRYRLRTFRQNADGGVRAVTLPQHGNSAFDAAARLEQRTLDLRVAEAVGVNVDICQQLKRSKVAKPSGCIPKERSPGTPTFGP